MAKIKNFIFDFGDVLYTINRGGHIDFLESIAGKKTAHGRESKDLKKLIADYESGVIPETLFFAAWEKLESSKLQAKELKMAWNNILGQPVYEQEEIIRELKSNFKLALLSNTNPTHLREFEKPAYPILRHFPQRYYSFEIGFIKPQLHAFAYVLKDNGFEPEETVMVDDQPANISAAEELGMIGVCLADPTHLASEIEKLGIF